MQIVPVVADVPRVVNFEQLTHYLDHGTGRMLVLVFLTVIVCVVGYYLVDKVRRSLQQTGPTASDQVTNFRELHASGQLSDEEFRNIKSMLSARLKDQLDGGHPRRRGDPKRRQPALDQAELDRNTDRDEDENLKGWPVDNGPPAN
ncbi:MAG: hypothetical protein JSS27_18980 [Planctomycetes bacterium]|nr:hypothetical protein [Planctomycetota bacterium]